MSALMTRRRRTPARDRDHRQASLFSQLVAPPAPPLERGEPEAAAVAAPSDAIASPAAPSAAPSAAPGAAPPAAPSAAPGAAPPAEPTLPSWDDAELSLEDAITALWDELTAGEVTDCPVCGEAMEPRHSAGAGVVGGRCTSCATTIA